jgi:hypothetical protein
MGRSNSANHITVVGTQFDLSCAAFRQALSASYGLVSCTSCDGTAGVLLAGVLLAGVLLLWVLLAGVSVAGVLLAEVLLAGVLLAEVLLAEVLLAGVLLAEVLLAGLLLAGVLLAGTLLVRFLFEVPKTALDDDEDDEEDDGAHRVHVTAISGPPCCAFEQPRIMPCTLHLQTLQTWAPAEEL